MRGCLFLSCLAVVSGSIETSRSNSVQQPLQFEEPALHNAQHLFNAIHSSMRQWGSSWFHNGMSFFLATIPAHTTLYHGTHEPQAWHGMEWLAFEPEHALMFARTFYLSPPDNKTAHLIPPGPQRPEVNLTNFATPLQRKPFIQHMLADPGVPKDYLEIPGYLHTYQPKHDLRLVYIDGLSAAKTFLGTMDTQYLCLSNLSKIGDTILFIDYELAQDLCHQAKHDWKGKIDGFIRMEGGFEIILCNFGEHLDFVDSHRPFDITHGDYHKGEIPLFRFIQAVASRYHGIGGEKVRLDYDRFVSAYTHNMDLFKGEALPKLSRASFEQRKLLKREVYDMVLTSSPVDRNDGKSLRDKKSFNWQSISDLLVTRYAGPLQYLTSPKCAYNIDIFHTEVGLLLESFLHIEADEQDFNKTRQAEIQHVEINRCVRQIIPPPNTWTGSLGGKVVQHVTHQVCSTLNHAFHATIPNENNDDDDNEQRLRYAVKSISDLRNWLDWSVWRECTTPSCQPDEVCVIPIWPLLGFAEDRLHPRCKNATQILADRRHSWVDDYWADPTAFLGPGIPLDPVPSAPVEPTGS